MDKLFHDVFPTLQLPEYYHELFAQVRIEHVKYTRAHTGINIYLYSEKLLEKKDVYFMEAQIGRQLFPQQEIEIHIYERFGLSQQYTLSNLLELYRESILLEFKTYSEIEYNLIRKAEWTAEGKRLILSACDGALFRSRKAEIRAHLQKILTERCGLDCDVHIELHAREKSGAEQQPFTVARPYQDQSRNPGHIQNGAAATAGAVRHVNDGADLPFDLPEAHEAMPAKPAPAVQGTGTDTAAAAASASGKYGTGRGYGGKGGSYGNGKKGGRYYGRPADPNMLFGRDVDGEHTEIHDIQTEMGEVVVKGTILSLTDRILNSGKAIFSIAITDYTDSIMVKIFVPEEMIAPLKEALKPNVTIIVKGITAYDRYDRELTISSVVGIKLSDAIKKQRMDHAPVKRVELHLHTQMSEFDGVSDIGDMIHLAKSWGHKALAITDHGVAYAFPQALHTLQADKDKDFKVIYGVEGYLVDDTKEIVTNLETAREEIALDDCAVVFDIETTGFSSVKNQIIEFGAVKVRDGKVVDRFSTFVNPRVPIPFKIEQLTGINDGMVVDSPDISVILPQFLDFCADAKYLVAHNANFDVGFIEHNAERLGLACHPVYLDTVGLSRFVLPNLNRFKLDHVAKELNIPPFNHHRAVDDAEATAMIYLELVKRLKAHFDIHTLPQLQEKAVMSPDQIKKLPTYHIILLAKNDTGRVNLYKLISKAHIEYFARRPRFPRSEIEAHREGLIIGSACEAGELFQAVLRGEGGEVIAKMVNFYDYLEIQPLGNNEFLLDVEGNGVDSRDDLMDLNRRIVQLGEQFGKPVVATCDVHFMNPEDEIYRRIIMAGQKFADADRQPPLYLRTTEEMLDEFAYLGQEKAYEVVVTNTNMIADMVENISPVRPDKCPPVIENSDVDLRNLCYENAHRMYGEKLPEIVEERLERELNSIISNGFAVMYIIAQKLVKKSNDDGYLVGSRGSVGSSFVATMAGITEVNPLSPHYLCPKCFYSDFDSDGVRAFAGGAGCDMPDKLCPVCGATLTKQGFDIPFETFLGFKGNKEPDIDLNFSGEYQSKAHDYTEVIFGNGQTFRAGTIGTLAEKTAYGYVKNYFAERGMEKRDCEINRLVTGCTGVRRTTGQHPGGIIVLPLGEDICTFTPVQRPANDMTTTTITTHFDYHSIDHNLLKLDILGHDDPTMIKMLEDLTCMDMKTVPLDSKEVMSLFMNTSALGVTPADILGCELGALGIPEFGTEFAMQMLKDAKPTKFSDLVRIAGLAHGTDVWLGNAQTLIQEGKADISTAICTRDDIMVYLINMGLESELSFTIMESVRKGKGLKPEWEKEMLAHDVPDWYIWSCNKIQYMFPKAHAAAYVMMAWRIAYCKIFYPLAYYAAYFSIRATGFSYELMCRGKAYLENKIAEYKARYDELSNKEQDEYKDMKVVQEMYARGFAFMPIDLYMAKATRFQIVDGKIMPSFASIEGLGDKAAEALEIAASQGEFLSRDDLRERSKISKTVVDKLNTLGLLPGLPESNQISLFDF